MMKLRWISILVLLVFALGCKDDKRKRDDDDREESVTCQDVAKHFVQLKEIFEPYDSWKKWEAEKPTLMSEAEFNCKRDGFNEKTRACIVQAPTWKSVQRCKPDGDTGQFFDCASSVECREHGTCTQGPKGTCVVGSQIDCAQSRDCQRKGWCSVTDVGGKRLCKP